MQAFSEDRIDDAFTLINKTGNTARSHRLSRLTPGARRLEDVYDGEVLFDIYYDGPTLKSLTYTEIFSSGIMINPCSDRLRYDLAMLALIDDDPVFDSTRLFEDGRLDKYRLIKYRERKTHDAVIFLPGTNLLEDAVDWNQVESLVGDGAMVKLHPLTSVPWRTKLEQRYGKAVIGRNISGHDVLHRTQQVITTSHSEIGLLGILMGKPVSRVDQKPKAYRAIYKQLYDAVLPESQQKNALEKVLGSRRAGIYWCWEPISRVDDIVNSIQETARDYGI